ncbi:hypothetical protein [Parasphingorhabdus sp.]|jgi:hypothetical protein
MYKPDELIEAVESLHDILLQLDELGLAFPAVKVSEALEILTQPDQQEDL